MRAFVKQGGVCDWREGHGREVYFDFEKITEDILEFYFKKIYRIEKGEDSQIMFKYSGEIDVGNKIGDVKYKVPQQMLT